MLVRLLILLPCLVCICFVSPSATSESAYYVTDGEPARGELSGPRIVAVDPISGDRHVASGPYMLAPQFADLDPSTGIVYVSDLDLPGLFRLASSVNAEPLVSGAGVGSGPNFLGPYGVISLDMETVLVVDLGLHAILSVDVCSGNRTVFSAGMNTPFPRGSGPNFNDPYDIDVLADGTFVVSDEGLNAVLSVDPVTGDRSILSSNTVGGGPALSFPFGLTITEDQQILLVDIFERTLFSIDPESGQRSVLTNNTIAFSGPLIDSPRDVVKNQDGNVFLSDLETNLILQVLPNGNRTVHSGLNAAVGNRGDGIGLAEPRGLLLDGSGILLCADAFLNGVIAIDADTGDRSIDERSRRGVGPAFLNPQDVIATATDTLVVVDGFDGLESILEVDLPTGDRSTLSGPETGTGMPLDAPYGIVQEETGAFVVTDQDSTDERIVRANSLTGDRTLLDGAGISFSDPNDADTLEDGTILVADSGRDAIMTVDPENGDRGILSSAARGTGNTFSNPVGLAIDHVGNVFVTDAGRNAVLSVNPVTGDRTVISDYPTGPNVGNGAHFITPVGIEVEDDGTIVVADTGVRAIFQVDPTTGNRMVLSGPDAFSGGIMQGSGPLLSDPRFVAIASSILWEPVCIPSATPTTTETPTPTETVPSIGSPTPTETPSSTTSPDLNGDGEVDADDLILLMEAWHRTALKQKG